MSFTHYLKALADRDPRVDGLRESEAHALFSAMLDGGIPDLELGAILATLQQRGESPEELIGFLRASAERVYSMEPPGDRLRPIVMPAYGGAREAPNLLPLLTLLLQRMGIPVLVHGTLEGGGRVAAAYVFRELGVMPSANLRSAQQALVDTGLAFVPTAVLSPTLAQLLALKSRLGMRSSGHLVAKLMDPFGGDSVLMVGASSPVKLELLADALTATGVHALLLRSCEGEPVSSAVHRPRIDLVSDGSRELLFEEENGLGNAVHGLVSVADAAATATWIRAALAGATPFPHPLVNQLACALYACGYTDDMNQAKAIAAVEAGGLTPGSRSGLRSRPVTPAPLR